MMRFRAIVRMTAATAAFTAVAGVVGLAASAQEDTAGAGAEFEYSDPAEGDRMPSGRDIGTRSSVVAPNAAAATAHPLATRVALNVMEDGGNAVDAAIAANAMLGLVEPTGNGIGGDLFAIVWDPETETLYGYNGSGRSPMGATLEDMQAAADEFMDGEEIPPFGAAPVTVPGTVDGWFALHDRFGKTGMDELLAPTVRYAREGAPIPEVIAYYWSFGPKRFEPAYESGMLEEYDNARATYFSPAPKEGSLFKNPDLANTLETIGADGRDAFYKGAIARTMSDYFERIGGYLRYEDFETHEGEWVDPLCAGYRDTQVCELPPNTQGIAALQMLQMLEEFDLRKMGHGSPDSLVAQIEAKRLAFSDRARGYADPAYSGIDPQAFIEKERNRRGASMIDLNAPMATIPDSWTADRFATIAAGDTGPQERVRLKFCMGEGGTDCQTFEGDEARAIIDEGSFSWCNEAGECRDIAVSAPPASEGEGSRVEVRRKKVCDETGECTETVEEIDLEAADKKLEDGDTTYLTVTDQNGMMVSLIQSNYRGMGSGLVADGLGFMFQDRGQLFSLDPAHPNVFEPGKRPFHTIIPAFAFRADMETCDPWIRERFALNGRMPTEADGEMPARKLQPCAYRPWMSFGLMGGGMQPQGHVQIILNLIDFDMGLQEAGDAARWEHTGGCEPTDDLNGDACETDMGVVHLESGIPPETRAELERRGYTVECCSANGGGYQAIMRDFESGAWIAATEMRKDGVAGGF